MRVQCNSRVLPAHGRLVDSQIADGLGGRRHVEGERHGRLRCHLGNTSKQGRSVHGRYAGRGRLSAHGEIADGSARRRVDQRLLHPVSLRLAGLLHPDDIRGQGCYLRLLERVGHGVVDVIGL